MTWRDIHHQLEAEENRFLAAIKGNVEAILSAFSPFGVDLDQPVSDPELQLRETEVELALSHFAKTQTWPLMPKETAAMCFQRVRMARIFAAFVCFPGRGPADGEIDFPPALHEHLWRWVLLDYPKLAGLPRAIYRVACGDTGEE